MVDEKDIEIARLRGKVEALEGELAKERALRLLQSPVPQVLPFGWPVAPLKPLTPLQPWPVGPEVTYGTCDLWPHVPGMASS